MTMNLNGPDSPPSIILKAEPESSESHINFVTGVGGIANQIKRNHLL